MSYIQAVTISSNSTNAIDAQNINEGLSGDPVYLVPVYTDSRDAAAHGFEIQLTYVKYYESNDSYTSDNTPGQPPFRYIYALRSLQPHGNLVNRLYLRSAPLGEGHTDNLNEGRPGAKALYLCWSYAFDDNQWTRIDGGRFAALQIVAAFGKLYARSQNEIWSYSLKAKRWDKLDTNNAIVEIAADNTALYQRHSETGQIWKWEDPFRWVKLDENSASSTIVAAGGNLYQFHKETGQIWRYVSNNWVKIDENTDNVQIAATDDKVYNQHASGNDHQIWEWSITDPTWRQLDKNPDISWIIAGGGTVLQTHDEKGQIWRYNRKWMQIEENSAVRQVVAVRNQVYKRHSNGEIFRYGGEGYKWESLGMSGQPVEELSPSDDGEVYVRMRNGEIWQLN